MRRDWLCYALPTRHTLSCLPIGICTLVMIIHGHILVLVTLVMTMINAISLKQGSPPYHKKHFLSWPCKQCCVYVIKRQSSTGDPCKKTDLSHNRNHGKVSAGRWCWCYLMVMMALQGATYAVIIIITVTLSCSRWWPRPCSWELSWKLSFWQYDNNIIIMTMIMTMVKIIALTLIWPCLVIR